MTRVGRVGRVAGAVVLASLMLTVPAASFFVLPAGAHGGAAEITVVEAQNVEPQRIEFTVEIRYVLDEHLAVPATFVVSGIGPDDETVESHTLEPTDDEGIYQVTVDFPVTGAWTTTFQSSLPPGELEHELVVGADAEPPGTVETQDAEETLVSSDGSGPPMLLLGGAAATAVVMVVAVVLVTRSARRP